MLRNDARGVVGRRATCWNDGAVSERAGGCRKWFATFHRMRDWVFCSLRLRVEFDSHGLGVDRAKRNLNVKQILIALLHDGRRAELQRGPLLRECRVPRDEIVHSRLATTRSAWSKN